MSTPEIIEQPVAEEITQPKQTVVEEIVSSKTVELEKRLGEMEQLIKKQQLIIDNPVSVARAVEPLTDKEKYLDKLFAYGTKEYEYGEKILTHLNNFINQSGGHIR